MTFSGETSAQNTIAKILAWILCVLCMMQANYTSPQWNSSPTLCNTKKRQWSLGRVLEPANRSQSALHWWKWKPSLINWSNRLHRVVKEIFLSLYLHIMQGKFQFPIKGKRRKQCKFHLWNKPQLWLCKTYTFWIL